MPLFEGCTPPERTRINKVKDSEEMLEPKDAAWAATGKNLPRAWANVAMGYNSTKEEK